MAEEKQKEYVLKYTEEEIVSELQALEKDEDIELFLRVQKGADKYNRYIKFLQQFEKEQGEK